jgi:hypothetical protein
MMHDYSNLRPKSLPEVAKSRVYIFIFTILILAMPQLAFTQARSPAEYLCEKPQVAGCKDPKPEAPSCGKVICLTGDNEWDIWPLKAGTRCADIGRCDGVDVDCVCPNTATGFIYPKYYVVGLVYAPPGCTSSSASSCSTQSSVDYQAGSSLGTTISTTNSFATDVSNSVNIDIAGLEKFGASFGFTNTSNDAHTQTISKGQSLEVKVNGSADGVDHDQDQFILLLNPAFGVAQLQSEDLTTNACTPIRVAQWAVGLSSLGPSGSSGTEDLYKVYVKWLKDSSTMPTDVANQLKGLGFTDDDFKTILSLDPFANGSTAIDNTRFVQTTYSFPYEPPLQDPSCNNGVCACLSMAETIKNELQVQNTSGQTMSYSVGFHEELNGIPLSDILKLGASVDQKFTWTSSSTKTNLTDSTQSAAATVGCPSVAYKGPTQMNIYWDTLFGSFMFAPTTATSHMAVLHQGRVLRNWGKPARYVPVQLSYAGRTYHTYTNHDGRFTIYGAPSLSRARQVATGIVTVKGTNKVVAIGPATQSVIQAQ